MKQASDEEVKAVLRHGPIEHIVKSFYDDFVELNVRARADAGMKEMVIREALGGCCEWCQKLAGIYEYGKQPKDFFKRHDNCTCVVTFKDEEGYTDVWSKKKYESQREARIAQMKEIVQKEGLKKKLKTKIRIARDEGKPLQFFRKLTVDNEIMSIQRLEEITLYRLMEYKENNIYISEGAKVKGRDIHYINKRINECYKLLGIQDYIRPDICVISVEEMGKNVVAAYNYETNTLFLTPQLGKNKVQIENMTRQFTRNEDPLATILHELIHWKTAMEYRKKNAGEMDKRYMETINVRAKKKLDKLNYDEYNVGEISEYAKLQYNIGNYDETYAEYLVMTILNKR